MSIRIVCKTFPTQSKEQCHEIFYHNFFLNILPMGPFSSNIFADTRFSRISSQTQVFREYLRRHTFFVNIFADTGFSQISSETHVFREYLRRHTFFANILQTYDYCEYLRRHSFFANICAKSFCLFRLGPR